MAKSSSGNNMLKGMTRKNPPGDSGMRPPSGSVNSDTTRTTVGKARSIGPREA